MPDRAKMMLLIILGLGALLLVGGAVSAGPDTGNKPSAGGCSYGSGGCGGCSGYDTDLSQTQLEALQREKEAFYNATLNLREEIVEKQRALAGELSNPAPDAGKARALQGELNDLKGEFNQKYLQFRIAAQKIVPGYGIAARQPAAGNNQPPCCTAQ